jgi:hypothetical protein
MPERMFATRADQNGASFYTFRWRQLERTMTHVFRAFDDAVFKADWAQRPRPALDPTKVEFFPSETTDPRWNVAKRQQVATELNHLNTFGHDTTGTAQAFIYYRALSADAARVLAGLSGNDTAFTQVTTAPLDPDDAANSNRRGPDDPDNFQIGDPANPLASPALRIFSDKLDGLVTNRYFYRSAYVDAAQNRSAFSLATPPVQAPSIVPPRAPVFTKAVARNRQVDLAWASNREANLESYRIYRTPEKESALDLRLMTLVHTETVGSVPPETRPVEVTWADTPLPPLVTFYYRAVAIDSAGLVSEPSIVMAARAYQNVPPAPPIWITVEWREEANTPVVFLRWTSPDPGLVCLLQRRAVGGPAWSTISDGLIAAADREWTFVDRTAVPEVTYEYRVRATDEAGNINTTYQVNLLPVSLF